MVLISHSDFLIILDNIDKIQNDRERDSNNYLLNTTEDSSVPDFFCVTQSVEISAEVKSIAIKYTVSSGGER